jgi:hypothetical protein
MSKPRSGRLPVGTVDADLSTGTPDLSSMAIEELQRGPSPFVGKRSQNDPLLVNQNKILRPHLF